MDDLAEADRFLLGQIAAGDGDAWGQLVGRYHGRLLAFARGRLRNPSDAEDLVQDTFAAFLQAFRSFRRDASLETYLFTILRRRLIDVFRGRGTGGLRVCSIHDAAGGSSGGAADADGPNPYAALPSPEPTASWYARQDEAGERLSAALAEAVRALADRLKAAQNLRDLKVVESLFYAQLRNKDAARVCGVAEGQVALLKHRWLKEVRAKVAGHLSGKGLIDAADGPVDAGTSAAADPAGDDPDADGQPDTDDDRQALEAAGSMLTEVWERLRPTCPKRSTLGQFVLGTLTPPWQDYVAFHTQTLGCRFCQANLDDLQHQDAAEPKRLRERIFQSTVGFLTRVGKDEG